jgi:hypothetical protein
MTAMTSALSWRIGVSCAMCSMICSRLPAGADAGRAVHRRAEEVAKLRVYLPEGGGGGPGVGDTEINTVSAGPTVATVAGYSPDCSSAVGGENGVI